MYKLAILGYWHVHANDYASQADGHEGTEITAVWDEDVERGRAEAAKRGVPFYENLDQLLASSEIDGVIVVTSTAIHHDVMTRAAKAGKHIFTEKVIALTSNECDDILRTVKQENVILTVSLPRLYEPYTLKAAEIIQSGILGELTLARTRLSHGGAIPAEGSKFGWLPERFFNLKETGGGALTDLGCHPMYLAHLFLGLPSQVSASYGYVTGREVEDNAAVTLRYENGAIAIVEAGFVNKHSPFSFEVHGTEGSLLYSDHDKKLLYRSGSDNQWQEATLPEALPSAFDQWIQHIEDNQTFDANIEAGAALTTLIEASNQSARSGKLVQLDQQGALIK
ncbi:Gfo/Idh/MocA family oxidoreductase [Paenibacillus sp. Marseille-Q4541]|uniref:Gfo/Idh/MocA family protein n=1 Tax=Paenibacillus sp. Marseille-Q4541 TaxID=2831522 RepID=UPI001BA98484